MAKIATLRELLIDELSDLYDAERQLADALPKMADAAHDENLKIFFAEQAKRVNEHIRRLERVFILLDAPSKGKQSQGMLGLLFGERARMSENAAPSVRDIALIGGAQKIAHFGIAVYGTVRTFAGLLGAEEIGELLQQTLADKIELDRALTALATAINPRAVKIGSD